MIRTVQIPLRGGRLGNDCDSAFWDVADPTCWFSDPLGVQPSLQINLPTCTSGTPDQQAACQAAAQQIQQQSAANQQSVSGSALAADIPGDVASSIADATSVPLWVWLLGGGVAALAILKR